MPGKIYVTKDPTMGPSCFIAQQKIGDDWHLTINTSEPCPSGEHVWKWKPLHLREGTWIEVCAKCGGHRSAEYPDRVIEQDMLPVTIDMLRSKYGFTEGEIVEGRPEDPKGIVVDDTDNCLGCE